MNKKYVIRWKSMVNGRAGKGTKLFNYDEAERLVAELNLEYPQIVHEVIEADLNPSATGTPADEEAREQLQLAEA